MPVIGQVGVPVPQTGIGLLDWLARMIRRDPMGGIGILRGGVPGDISQFAGQVHPNLFRALAQSPQTTYILQNQAMKRAGESGLLDVLRALHPRGTPEPLIRLLPTAAPESAFIRLQPNPGLYAPTHESIHVLNFFKQLMGYPPERSIAALSRLPTRVPTASPGEHAIQRMSETSVNNLLGLPPIRWQ